METNSRMMKYTLWSCPELPMQDQTRQESLLVHQFLSENAGRRS